MQYNQLGKTDMKVSNYALGCSAFSGMYGTADETECIAIVKEGIKRGIKLIDTAPWYGQGRSESILGKVLPKLQRASYYLSAKVGRYEKAVDKMFDFSAERTLQSVDESLQRMGVDYVDIIQVHDLEFAPSIDIVLNETLPALQTIKEKGKARYIGVTGYPIEKLKKVVEKSAVKIDTVLSYCHGSMNDNSLQEHVDFFEDRGLGIINASGMSMGLLSPHGPSSWHPAGENIRNACKQANLYCEERGVNICKLALNFAISQPRIPTTLFSTASMKEFQENLSIVENGISKKEEQVMAEIIERYFDPLEVRTWEGVELQNYRAALNR